MKYLYISLNFLVKKVYKKFVMVLNFSDVCSPIDGAEMK